MSDSKLFAGPMIRRLRQGKQLTQLVLAERLGISPSYLNLIEKNRRPLGASLLIKLASEFDVDPRQLAADAPGGGIDALSKRLADPMFSDLEIDRDELREWLTAAPRSVEAFVRLFEQRNRQAESGPVQVTDARIDAVRREIERWRNHFADLDYKAEELADELRLVAGDMYSAISERLRVKHQISLRILPETVMPEHLRRLDLHARQLQLSEMLDPASRTFQAALLLGQFEAKEDFEALVAAGEFADRTTGQLYRRHLQSYFAAAVVMPYARFLRACEQTGYNIDILQRRFGAGFEQVAHRLTTLQRVGARGLPFFMLRIDRAGQASKRFAGASKASIVDSIHFCPLWQVHHCFERPADILTQLIGMEDGSAWFTLSRSVRGPGSGIGGSRSQFSISLGVAAEHAAPLIYAQGIDLSPEKAQPVGPGCRACHRVGCVQRSAPPLGQELDVVERERGLEPFAFGNR